MVKRIWHKNFRCQSLTDNTVANSEGLFSYVLSEGSIVEECHIGEVFDVVELYFPDLRLLLNEVC